MPALVERQLRESAGCEQVGVHLFPRAAGQLGMRGTA